MMNDLFELGIAVVLLCVGLIAGFQKKLTIGLGPSHGGSPHPLFSVSITGSRTVVFAFVTVIAAISVILIWLHYNPIQGSPIDDTGIVGFTALSAIGVSLFCFAVCAFFELLHFLEQHNKQ
ncbi:MAG: hypothetical protein KF716_33795 [Anaerolineae bacterium]|nr:hypothetical protein [Anaerolineae bacterium]